MRTISRQERVAHVIASLEEYDPQRVILFGSWARGDEDEHSDLDLVIIKETQERFLDRLARVYDLVKPTFQLYQDRAAAFTDRRGQLLDALDVLAEDNEKNLERMREGAPDLYLRVSEESNTARSVFLNEPKNEPKEAE